MRNLSRIIRKGEHSDKVRSFEFSDISNFDDTQEKKAKQQKFLPDRHGDSDREFVPGGFDFDYKGGLRRDEILSKSLDESRAIIEEAKIKAESTFAEAKAEGFQQGHAEGYADGLKEAQPVIESFQTAVDKLLSARAEFYSQAEKEMIELVMSVAHEVIGINTDQDPALAKNVILKAVEQLRLREKMTVRINPDDLAEAEKVKPELSRKVEDIEKVDFKTDSLVTRGGCIIETNIGMIDARLESQLESIRASFIKVFEEGKSRQNQVDDDS